jgi:hypothetical protein
MGKLTLYRLRIVEEYRPIYLEVPSDVPVDDIEGFCRIHHYRLNQNECNRHFLLTQVDAVEPAVQPTVLTLSCEDSVVVHVDPEERD